MVVDYYQVQNVIDAVHVDYFDDHLGLHDQNDRHPLFLLVHLHLHLDDDHLQMNDHHVEVHVDPDPDHVVNVNDL